MNQNDDWNDESIPEWRVIRAQIRSWISERTRDDREDRGLFLREMEEKFPEYSWVEIAGWMVGFTIPNTVQQCLLWEWVQSRSVESNVKLLS